MLGVVRSQYTVLAENTMLGTHPTICPSVNSCVPSDNTSRAESAVLSTLQCSLRGWQPGGQSDFRTMKLVLSCHEGSSTFTTRTINLDSTGGQVTVLRSSPQQGRILSLIFAKILSTRNQLKESSPYLRELDCEILRVLLLTFITEFS